MDIKVIVCVHTYSLNTKSEMNSDTSAGWKTSQTTDKAHLCSSSRTNRLFLYASELTSEEIQEHRGTLCNSMLILQFSLIGKGIQ